MKRVYLDHNATTPLRLEARKAMLKAMDLVGNPSSVHAEGRASKMLIGRARAQVAALVGCKPMQVIFTGSATEAAALAVAQKNNHGGRFAAVATEHDCLEAWSDVDLFEKQQSQRRGWGAIDSNEHMRMWIQSKACTPEQLTGKSAALVAVSAANGETGIIETATFDGCEETYIWKTNVKYSKITDLTQAAGKLKITPEMIDHASYAILSAHKIGGPKGVGALINFTADDPQAIIRGGGQEMGRRSGTENVIGIAGFGAAAQAAHRDVMAGKWTEVEKLRNILERALEAFSKKTIFVGKEVPRLPNTSCFITPGWKGDTQVMQMDLAGFAISAGSACSSGKVKASRVLKAMGYSDLEAASAVRVSLGLETTEDDVLRFAQAWGEKLKKQESRAA
ncbi:MAG: aminotransferase class V-fold PLP-dependent enzyme [Paracoccaceae bacterium]